MAIIENPNERRYFQTFITNKLDASGEMEEYPTEKAAPFMALLSALEAGKIETKDISPEKMDIISMLGNYKSGVEGEHLSNVIEYAMRNLIDPKSASIDKGTMTPYGAGTAYTIKSKTHGGEDRTDVRWADGIPTDDRAASLLGEYMRQVEKNPEYSDTTTTQEYEKLMITVQ